MRYENTRNFNAVAASFDFGVVKVMASDADPGKATGWDAASGAFSIGTANGFGVGAVASIAGFNVGVQYGDNSDSNIKTNGLKLFINPEIFNNTCACLDYGHSTDFPVPGGEGGIVYKSATACALGINCTV